MFKNLSKTKKLIPIYSRIVHKKALGDGRTVPTGPDLVRKTVSPRVKKRGR